MPQTDSNIPTDDIIQVEPEQAQKSPFNGLINLVGYYMTYEQVENGFRFKEHRYGRCTGILFEDSTSCLACGHFCWTLDKDTGDVHILVEGVAYAAWRDHCPDHLKSKEIPGDIQLNLPMLRKWGAVSIKSIRLFEDNPVPIVRSFSELKQQDMLAWDNKVDLALMEFETPLKDAKILPILTESVVAPFVRQRHPSGVSSTYLHFLRGVGSLFQL